MSNRRTRLSFTIPATMLGASSFILGAASVTSAASAKSNISVQPAKPPASAGAAVRAHWESPPDKFALTLPCTDTDYIPKTGLCHGTGSGHADLTGTWKGTTVYEYGFATTPANVSQLSIIQTFTGTINGCGTGSMSYRLFGTLSATGKIDLEWQTVEGFGSGALAGATGHGTATGIYKADFSTTGDFTGVLRCPRTATPS